MLMTHNFGVAARTAAFELGAVAMGTRMSAYAGIAALTVKPRVQGTDVANGGVGAGQAWSPPD